MWHYECFKERIAKTALAKVDFTSQHLRAFLPIVIHLIRLNGKQ